MKAIDFIKQNPNVKEWRVRVWTWRIGAWQDISLLDLVTEKYPTATKLYFSCADESKGEVWVTE